LEGVAVDEHRRAEGLEAWHAEGVEDASAYPPEVRLAGGDVPNDLLFVLRLEVAPPVDHVDCHAGRHLSEAIDKVSDRRVPNGARNVRHGQRGV